MKNENHTMRNTIITLLLIVVIGYFLFFNQNQTTPIQDNPLPTVDTTNSYVTPTPQSTCYTSQQAYYHIGESGCVDYYVGYPYRSRNNEFLDEKTDFKNGFAAVINTIYLGNFSQDPLSLYGYKQIEVSGIIQSYQGHPEIIVQQQSQITTISQ